MKRLVTDKTECNREMICRYENCEVSEEYCPHLQEDNCPCLQEILEKLGAYQDAEEQGLLLRNPKDLENAILNRMQEFMDEWRHYSESSTDHFGGKADSMETAMKIVKGAFEQALEPKTTTKQHTTTNPVDKEFDDIQEGGIYQATVTYNVNGGVFVKLKGEVDCLCSFPTCGTLPVPGQNCTVTVTQKVIAEDGTKKIFGKFVTLD